MPPQLHLPLFVYGTLRTGQSNWMRLLKGRMQACAPAHAPRHVMYASGVPYVTDHPTLQVVGEIMELDAAQYDVVLTALDVLEGVNHQVPEAGHYLRVVRPVVLTTSDATRTLDAYIYHASPWILATLRDVDCVPGGDWLAL